MRPQLQQQGQGSWPRLPTARPPRRRRHQQQQGWRRRWQPRAAQGMVESNAALPCPGQTGSGSGGGRFPSRTFPLWSPRIQQQQTRTRRSGSASCSHICSLSLNRGGSRSSSSSRWRSPWLSAYALLLLRRTQQQQPLASQQEGHSRRRLRQCPRLLLGRCSRCQLAWRPRPLSLPQAWRLQHLRAPPRRRQRH